MQSAPNNILVRVILLCLTLSPALIAEPIKAVTWNIEWFPGGRPYAPKEERDAQIAAAKVTLEKLSPDIFLAQELGYQPAFEDLISVVPNMKLHTFSSFLGYDRKTVGPQQCAIASTLTADSAWFEAFEPSKGLPNLSRGFAFAALNHPDGGLIMVYSVHLKSNRGSETPEGEQDVADTRAESVRQIIAHKAAMEKKFKDKEILGWLIGGDFNSNHDGQFPKCTAIADLVEAGFHNSWDKTPKEKRETWLSDPDPEDRKFHPTTFDYLLTIGFAEKQAILFPGFDRKSSDHAPIGILLMKP
ncbi:hypothetical protein [Luteolibacter sp. AS25]|uniref:hypothetical protein n=1 Tax=Luteolibacter sp. AS25 TaxID=3135776 RepID=UPI00398AA247